MARVRSINPAIFTDEEFEAACAVSHQTLNHLYVVQEEHTGPFKIGRSRNALWRLSDLSSGNWRRLYMRAIWVGDSDSVALLEKQVHQSLSSRRLSGEWFNVSLDEIVETVSDLCGRI